MDDHRTLQEKFEEFHADNPHVWKLWIRFSLEMIEHGYKVLSSNLLINRIRWETNIVTRSNDRFKICNNHCTYYARLWNASFPHLAQFRTKELRSV